jgi:hypothetical protein
MLNFYLRSGTRHSWPWVYATRRAEALCGQHQIEGEWCAPDLIESDTPKDEVLDGIHPATLYGQDATLFLWNAGQRGLLCLNSDEPALEYAKRAFDAKKTIL